MSLLALARRVAEVTAAAGGRTFLVGGPVRDRLLGRELKDLDLEVYGLPWEQIQELCVSIGKVHMIGRSFPVLQLVAEAGIAEIALPRIERKTGPGHRGFEMTGDPFLDPKVASSRRDFRVNAMMEDPLSGEILDFHEGQRDLRQGVLRHVSAAFAEDPLRAMRAGRFVARYGWRVARETSALCRSLDLSELPCERMEGEWQKLLEGDFPGHGLLALEACGVLRFFPELQAMRGVPQDPLWHPEGDVLHHTALCLNAAVQRRAEMEDPWAEMLGVLCHDLGKAGRGTQFERGRWRCPAHDVDGAELVPSLLARLNTRKEVVPLVQAFTREHLRPSQLFHARDRVSDAAIRRLSLRVPIEALCRVAWSDAAGREQILPQPWEPEQWLLQRAAQLGVEKGQPKAFLRGQDCLERGWPAGKAVGQVLAQAFELQIEGELADREAALSWLDQQPRPTA